MELHYLTYPFLFLALYFESFMLVSLLSGEAVRMRSRAPARVDDPRLPTVAIIVPCYNEEKTIAGTIESLLALTYPRKKLEVVLVNDGSTDGTASVMQDYAVRSQVKIIHKTNGGKHTALNAGIAATNADIVGCLDADSFVETGALLKILPCFDDPRVAASTVALTVHRPRSILERMQQAEYSFGVVMRHTMASVNGLYVTPGPFSLYRRSVVLALGGFRYGHQTEDLEMALRLQKHGYRIDNAPGAKAFTTAPKTVPVLMRQRTRWVSGFLRNALKEYRSMIGNPRHGVLGAIVLPLAVIAIVGGITLFFALGAEAMMSVWNAFAIREGIPLAYAYLPRMGAFNWFYLPTTFYVVIGVVLLCWGTAYMYVGKWLSRTPTSLALGVLSYLVLYGILAPLWFMRAAADVALGTKRAWK